MLLKTVSIDQITIDDTTTNATYYPTFQIATSGINNIKVSSTKLTYNPSTGAFSATTFIGALTGNVTGNVTGSSGSCTGNSATVTGLSVAGGKTLTVSKTITLTGADDTSVATLPAGAKTLLATDGNGSSLTGLTKSQVGLGSVENTALSTWAGSANIITVGTITTGVWNGTAIDVAHGGATGTNTGDQTTADDTTTNANYYPVFQTATSGTNPLKVSSTKLTYNPNLGALTAVTFVGALTGNVTGNCSGSSGSCTGNAATTTTATNTTNSNIIDDTTSNATMYPIWVTTNTGNLPLKVSSTKVTFNPSTGNFSATTFNKITLTIPAAGSTLTIIDGKTFTVNKTISFTSADDTGVYTLPTGTKTIPAATDVHYIGTTSIALNRASAAQDLAGITSLTPGANFGLVQNGVNAVVSAESGAIANTINLNAGGVGLGTSGVSYYGLHGLRTLTGAATQIGFYSHYACDASATTYGIAYRSLITSAPGVTTANMYGYVCDGNALGAAGVVTTNTGYYCADQTIGATNYGYRSLVSSGANKWNIYADGTAVNYMAGGLSIGAATTPTAILHLKAGTASANTGPLKMNKGTVVTTPEEGLWEFDTNGNTPTFSPVASNRGVVNVTHFTALTADFTGTNVNTAQPVFNATTNGTITLPASTSYYMEAQYVITRAAGITSHTLSILFGGTATFTSIMYVCDSTSSTGDVITADSKIYATVATATVVTAASIVATENIIIQLKGIVRINGAGTLIPQIKYDVAPGGAPTFLANSFIRLTPIGINTVSNVGNWS